MDVTEMVARTRETMTAGRVFGEPVVRDGVTVIPVARVSGGGGAGGGESPAAEDGTAGSGSGGGFGLGVAPAGVFVLRDDGVTWRPAVDVNRIVAGGQLVMVVALLTLRSYLRSRSDRR
ncbi:spore germination protein GerW family protein [Pseudonocardia sp. 73-21]|uniref:spore germination protein GerW family protein n=1 Tax=Pseudonocardia sp. 73-21 TaxID=1895809 RepID=UPI0009668FAF|nr:spore germination protein GerW family protein [Pseudonocardia sp. 73-21]OJY53972.1 MAG: sporulation protein [Pseudonocardia sp. 73-21]